MKETIQERLPERRYRGRKRKEQQPVMTDDNTDTYEGSGV